MRSYRDRLKRGGRVRCEVTVHRDDVDLIRTVAAALRDPESGGSARALLRERFSAPVAHGFKELLASCPLEGLDLTRARDVGRDIDI
jgi:hypothetical protein